MAFMMPNLISDVIEENELKTQSVILYIYCMGGMQHEVLIHKREIYA